MENGLNSRKSNFEMDSVCVYVCVYVLCDTFPYPLLINWHGQARLHLSLLDLTFSAVVMLIGMADVTFSTFRRPEYKRSNIPNMWNVVFIKTSLWVLIISNSSFKEVHDWPLDCRHWSICVGGQLLSMMDS